MQYGLENVWLNQCGRNRLDAFHCKCLRRVMKIQHSYFSRISNMQILAAAVKDDLSTTLIKQQLKSFGRVATSNNTHPLRRLVLDSNHRFRKFSFNPRPVGRPKQCWNDGTYKIALSPCCSKILQRAFHHAIEYLDKWHQLINNTSLFIVLADSPSSHLPSRSWTLSDQPYMFSSSRLSCFLSSYPFRFEPIDKHLYSSSHHYSITYS